MQIVGGAREHLYHTQLAGQLQRMDKTKQEKVLDDLQTKMVSALLRLFSSTPPCLALRGSTGLLVSS